MRLRKIPLVIHVDPLGLVLLRKTCRLCLVCEMLIAHEAEVAPVISGFLRTDQDYRGDYVVLGTLESLIWRRGLAGSVAIDEIRDHMADFKAYMRVEITPAHWTSKDERIG